MICPFAACACWQEGRSTLHVTWRSSPEKEKQDTLVTGILGENPEASDRVCCRLLVVSHKEMW